MEIIAHRGASRLAPENTLASQRLAYEFGADYVEMDVRMTRDGIPVNFHDHFLERTTNGTGLLASLTLEQLKQLDAGSWFGPEFAGERVPALAEMLELARLYNRKLILDIKGDGIAPRVIDVIRKSGISLYQIAFLTYRESMTAEYTRLLPDAKILFAPLVPASGTPVQPAQINTTAFADLHRQKVTVMHIVTGNFNRSDIRRFHSNGFEVSAIYLDPGSAFFYKEMGVDYFWTDFTDVTMSRLGSLDQEWSNWAESSALAPDQRSTWMDSDSDGMDNLTEFALGTDPLAPSQWASALRKGTNTIGWTVNLREDWSRFLVVTAQTKSGSGPWNNVSASCCTSLSPSQLDYNVPLTPDSVFFRMKFDLKR